MSVHGGGIVLAAYSFVYYTDCSQDFLSAWLSKKITMTNYTNEKLVVKSSITVK